MAYSISEVREYIAALTDNAFSLADQMAEAQAEAQFANDTLTAISAEWSMAGERLVKAARMLAPAQAGPDAGPGPGRPGPDNPALAQALDPALPIIVWAKEGDGPTRRHEYDNADDLVAQYENACAGLENLFPDKGTLNSWAYTNREFPMEGALQLLAQAHGSYGLVNVEQGYEFETEDIDHMTHYMGHNL